jgi:release factor glutamine methyltransferase
MRTDRGGLLVHRDDPLDPTTARRYAQWIRQRQQRVPLQHLTGTQEFYGLAFKVDRRALVPRPETELLVQAVLALGLEPGAEVVDVGTGTGCIAITLAVQRPDLRVHGLDRSAGALELARENAEAHGVARRIGWVLGDLDEAPPGWRGKIDLVVSNPPYVSEGEWKRLQPEVRDHDPHDALVAGPTGYEVYEELIPCSSSLLRPSGLLVLELGFRQAARVHELVAAAGFGGIEVGPDLQGIPRVLVARLEARGAGPRPGRPGV